MIKEEVTVTLNQRDINTISLALIELPYKQVYETINNLNRQLQEQMNKEENKKENE
jgi:hypothetical protein